MDEPFGALDAITRDSLQQEFLDLKKHLNKTIIFVTHDIVEAVTLGDRIAILHKGRLEQIGTPEEIMVNPPPISLKNYLRNLSSPGRGSKTSHNEDNILNKLHYRTPARYLAAHRGSTFFLQEYLL